MKESGSYHFPAFSIQNTIIVIEYPERRKSIMNTEITRPVVMEVNLSDFEHNISQIRARVGEDVTIMPVINHFLFIL